MAGAHLVGSDNAYGVMQKKGAPEVPGLLSLAFLAKRQGHVPKGPRAAQAVWPFVELSRAEGGLGLGDDVGEGLLVADGEVGEDLAIEVDTGDFEAVHEL